MMKALFSPLLLVDFLILKSHFDLIPSTTEIDFRKTAAAYVVNIDFAITTEAARFHKVFMKIAVNQVDKPLPGYTLFAEGVGLFELTTGERKLSKEDATNQHYSALSIVLNNLRGFLSDFSAYGPLGKYLLPSIDLNDLIHQKRMETKNKTTPKKKMKKA